MSGRPNHRTGEALANQWSEHIITRFMSRVVAVAGDTDGCWEWTGSKTPTGYARLSWTRQGEIITPACRISYLLFRGEIPHGLEIDHLCRNRGCVNPRHLEAVTHAENLRRAALARPTCPAGHAYDYISPDGARRCRECARIGRRKYHHRYYVVGEGYRRPRSA